MKFVAEYLWIGPKGEIRGKSRTVDIDDETTKNMKRDGLLNPELYSEWSYDGSSTEQSDGFDSEIIIRPISVFRDPFRKGANVLVLCDSYRPNGKPTKENTRLWAKSVFEKIVDKVPWYGIEQEFFLMMPDKENITKESIKPLGWTEDANPQGQYYCAVGHNNSFGRSVAEQAYHLALEAGLTCSGMNAEVAPGQWEIQVGPCEGLDAGDHLNILRYILQRVGETNGVQINLEPKPVKGDWNGSGCHVNFSTLGMRESDNGKELILEAVHKLEGKHMEHMEVYGEGNRERMSGKHETASYDKFTYGVANRGASIRIPRLVETMGKGYFEDRRPASNMDPYLVTAKIAETCCL